MSLPFCCHHSLTFSCLSPATPFSPTLTMASAWGATAAASTPPARRSPAGIGWCQVDANVCLINNPTPLYCGKGDVAAEFNAKKGVTKITGCLDIPSNLPANFPIGLVTKYPKTCISAVPSSASLFAFRPCAIILEGEKCDSFPFATTVVISHLIAPMSTSTRRKQPTADSFRDRCSRFAWDLGHFLESPRPRCGASPHCGANCSHRPRSSAGPSCGSANPHCDSANPRCGAALDATSPSSVQVM